MLILKVGRRRRKKCNEVKPTCTGCTRNCLTCIWPSRAQVASRRRWVESTIIATDNSMPKDGVPMDSKSQPERWWTHQPGSCHSDKSSLLGSFNSVTAISVPNDSQFSILKYCLHYYLPIQVHHCPGQEPVDQSYLVSMALHSSALMNALLACSALTLRHGSQSWQSFAVGSYVLSLNEVGKGIADGSFTGTEDLLLATVMWLCIFEV